MIMARSSDGLPVEFVGRPKITRQDVMRTRDLSVIRMRQRGYTFAAIASFHGISVTHAFRLYRRVPEHVRNRSIEVLDRADLG